MIRQVIENTLIHGTFILWSEAKLHNDSGRNLLLKSCVVCSSVCVNQWRRGRVQSNGEDTSWSTLWPRHNCLQPDPNNRLTVVDPNQLLRSGTAAWWNKATTQETHERLELPLNVVLFALRFWQLYASVGIGSFGSRAFCWVI